jgi:hypothetical protein
MIVEIADLSLRLVMGAIALCLRKAVRSAAASLHV